MSVDKFGRYNPYPRWNHGSTFHDINLTYEGDVDFQFKRLCNVADAILDEDAVNLNTLKYTCLYQNDEMQFDAASKNIINLAQPKSPTDAATKSYVDEKLPVIINEIEKKLFQKTNNEVDFANLRLANIASPLNMSDAVNKAYLFEKLSFLKDNIYRILYNIYLKTAIDNPIKNKEDWIKEYL